MTAAIVNGATGNRMIEKGHEGRFEDNHIIPQLPSPSSALPGIKLVE
jgi:hypothetical protein